MGLLLQFVTLVVFAFAAPAFTFLAFSYWRQERKSSRLFGTFTILCATLFAANLIGTVVFIDYPFVSIARGLLIGIVPVMMFHIILQDEFDKLVPRALRVIALLLYLAAVLIAVLPLTNWRGQYSSASPGLILAAASLTIVVVVSHRRYRTPLERHQFLWNVTIFTILLLAAWMSVLSENPFFDLLPDYCVLLFFSAHLYYTERLAFFDVFIRSGAFFLIGAILVALTLAAVPSFHTVFGNDWFRAWIAILVLMPVWLLAPLAYKRVSGWVDQALDRKYSAAQAERLFMQAVQSSNTEEQLSDAARAAAEDIFHSSAEVVIGLTETDASHDELLAPIGHNGYIRLLARTNRVPFLSADKRLLSSLSTSLDIVLQNLRLRAQERDRQQREQELKALATRAELRALRAQIDPHFLFNALNAIAGWIRTEPEFADETLSQLAEVFRYTLRRSQKEWVPVEEEIEFVESYLAIERARFRDRLEVEVSVSPEASRVSIPAMIIQPLIENAIKHGISQARGAGELSVHVTTCDDMLRIRVLDNGPGFPTDFSLANGHSGHGLLSVQQRVSGYFADRGMVHWGREDEKTFVAVEIPKTEHE